MTNKITTVILLSIILWSCSENNATFRPQYFDVNAVVVRTIKLNEISKPTFEKVVNVNGEKEETVSVIKDWKKELEIFLLADLNKKDYLNKFEKDSSVNKLIYRLAEKQEAQVKNLEIKFDKGNVSEITAVLQTDNFLYKSERKLSLYFYFNDLVKYEVYGWQQLFVGNKKTYQLTAKKQY